MKAITIISVPVTDQQKAKAFYLNIGFNLIIEAPMGESGLWIQLGLPNNGVSITLVNWFPKMSPGSMQGLVIETEDIEKERNGLLSKGITVSAVDNTPWGKFASFEDPDGNGLTLHQQG